MLPPIFLKMLHIIKRSLCVYYAKYNKNTPPPIYFFEIMWKFEMNSEIKVRYTIVYPSLPWNENFTIWGVSPHSHLFRMSPPSPPLKHFQNDVTYIEKNAKNWRERCLNQLRSSAISFVQDLCIARKAKSLSCLIWPLNLTTRYTYNETNRKLTTWRSLLPPFL